MSAQQHQPLPLPLGTTPGLDLHHYETLFGVLEDCERASTVTEFRDLLLTSLAENYHVASTTFFVGSTLQLACADPTPVLTGTTRSLLPEYQERWYRLDLFGNDDSLRAFHTSKVAALGEMRTLSEDSQQYVAHWLYRYELRSATAMALDLPGGRVALVGLFDRDVHRIGAAELASLRLLAKPLSRIAVSLPDPEQDPDAPQAPRLSPRQAQVATLVSQGLSNRSIADVLNLHEDSVKKYVSRILAETGCHNRTELALRVRSGQL